MKNAMLNAIPKSQFLRLVTEATNDFKKLYENGVDIAGADAGDKLVGVKKAIADSGIKKSVADVFVTMMLLALGSSPAVVRKPTAEEIQKQFLTFVSYACVVPLRNRNHHKYEIGSPVIMILGCPGTNTGMYGMDEKGIIHTPGDELPRLRKSLRPATNYEINRIVDKLYA
uniref:Uncharacterized protein n=1 Tax=viral metagenome TaxID=1070528 RepID=A0A6H1ZH51_9ZZZZ